MKQYIMYHNKMTSNTILTTINTFDTVYLLYIWLRFLTPLMLYLQNKIQLNR
ncbi:hypothetical protein HanXRQr2_Chr08g0328201 [Helianthus annuus]|uniref:Uncharacterized protein n=1 Tax=Helianthus annuus TaxID=4232 RepID=A0A9K3NBR9_HELAN|nr:hypothetical protein HanXRQr2_Chr08g0328201 [Helianthus annuus]